MWGGGTGKKRRTSRIINLTNAFTQGGHFVVTICNVGNWWLKTFWHIFAYLNLAEPHKHFRPNEVFLVFKEISEIDFLCKVAFLLPRINFGCNECFGKVKNEIICCLMRLLQRILVLLKLV